MEKLATPANAFPELPAPSIRTISLSGGWGLLGILPISRRWRAYAWEMVVPNRRTSIGLAE
jgi:hypothetical protein